MRTRFRAIFAVVFMSIGLLATIVDSQSGGWTTLGVVGVACLAVAIAAELVALRSAR